MFNIKGDMKPIIKHLNKTQKKQIPFAAAQAINSTLFNIMKAEKAQLQKKLDRPTPFTLSAFKINKAKKTKLIGDIHIQPERYKYLKYQIEGGTRSGTNIGVPTVNAKLNKYGNIPARRKGLIKNKKQFISNIGGVNGVWERTKSGKSKLIVAFHSSVDYKPRFPFYKIADGVTRKRFQRNFTYSLERALRTAK